MKNKMFETMSTLGGMKNEMASAYVASECIPASKCKEECLHHHVMVAISSLGDKWKNAMYNSTISQFQICLLDKFHII